MGQKKRPKMTEDELIENLVPDPSQVPETKVLFGLLGKSSRKGSQGETYCRLYTTPDLKEYDEFLEEEVCYYKRLDTEQSPLGGTFVFLNQDANVIRTSTVSRKAQADFLQGKIASAFMPTTPLQGQVGGGLAGRGTWGWCTLFYCPTRFCTHPGFCSFYCSFVALPCRPSADFSCQVQG